MPTEISGASSLLSSQVLEDWQRNYIAPIRDAVYGLKLNAAQRLLAEARRNLILAELDEGGAEAAGFLLDLLDINIRFMAHPQAWCETGFQVARRQLERLARTEPGRQARLAALVQLRCAADKDGICQLSKAEAEEFIDQLQPAADNSSIWHELAGWAFAHKEADVLGLAFEAHSIHPSSVLGQAKWQRINIMYQLLCGKASRRDVEETIHTLAVLPQLAEFMAVIWPACSEAGLVDSEFEALLVRRASRIRSNAPLPQREAATKSMRTPI